MKKIFTILAILPILALSFISIASAQERTISIKNAGLEEMPLSCQVLFIFVKWGIQHPDQYIWIADFNKDKVVSAIDFSIFGRNRNNDGWCSKQLGW